MTPKLSILIPTLPSRGETRIGLIESLCSQGNCKLADQRIADDMFMSWYIGPEIEILLCEDDIHIIGKKRQLMLEMAIGQYVVFVDDDDEVSGQYVNLILGATNTGPDVVGIVGTITHAGQNQETWEISNRFKKWSQLQKKGRWHYLRSPNHLAPIKREIALKVGYKSIGNGEDADYSERLVQSRLCHTEVRIKENIYHYRSRG